MEGKAMMDAYIIERLKKDREGERNWQPSQIPLELPVDESERRELDREIRRKEKEKDEIKRGVTVYNYS
ncbi:MAG TPA: hypothetical protein VFG11_00050 [Acidobacteriota bacterium]|nr:hypothetical protein [Acidobacteriota bacterium]